MDAFFAWFATLSPEGQMIGLAIGTYMLKTILPLFWRFTNRQQAITDKALDTANDTTSSNAKLIQLLSDNLGAINETNKRLERLAERNQDVLARVDQTTLTTQQELRNSNFAQRLSHLEDLQAKQIRLLIAIYKQSGGIIPAKGTP